MTQKLIKNLNQIGGGISLSAILAILPNLNAVELSQICTSGQQCKIENPQATITNHSHFITGGSEGIYIETTIGTFTNYGDIVIGGGNQAFTFKNDGYIGTFINYGTIGALSNMSFWGTGKGISNLTNYGTMGAIDCENCKTTMTLNNLGTIGSFNGFNIRGKILIENYALRVSENAEIFNQKANGSLSHLVISGNGVSFKDSDSRIILDFGGNFEFETPYKTANLASGLSVDFGRLAIKSDIFTLTQSGENFIVKLNTASGTIGNLYKSNIRTMNNFFTISNSMIYPHKKASLNRTPKKKRVIRRVRKTASAFRHSELSQESEESKSSYISLDSSLRALHYTQNDEFLESIESFESIESYESIQSLKSHESFAYKNNSTDLLNQSTNHHKVSLNQTKNQSTNRHTSQANSNTIQSTKSDKYYFILTPFINHNLFFESGRYNLSGFDGGFLTAFSGKLTSNHSLGTHFMISYGSLGDSQDKNFSISNLNLNLGINYKLDLIWDMYLKARGDFFYFLNQVKTLTMIESIKPNNLGFGVSVSYGKDFDFKQGGVLGIEGGIDYKALSASEITLDSMSETYQKSLYHLLYVDLGISYAKYFNSSVGLWGFNTNLGFKGNITANKLAKSKISLNNFNRSVDMVLDNDKYLGYANVALSYVLNHRNFDMEFSLSYYGNFGDRVISNGGGFEWRVGW